MSQRICDAKNRFHKAVSEAASVEEVSQAIKDNPVPTIIGLCTDSRNPARTYLDAKNELMRNSDYESQYCYFNLFTVGCIKVNGTLTTSVNDLLEAMEVYICGRK